MSLYIFLKLQLSIIKYVVVSTQFLFLQIEHLQSVARKYIGKDWSSVDVNIWAGIMPLSPDDFPVIGRTKKFSNLYINTGHGFRGTAYSLPSARLLVQIIKGDDVTCFDRKFADPSRFQL